MKENLKQRYISSAFLLLVATIIVKIISAVYKIPLTGYIGATGRGYFSVAYNLCMPIHALTMGAFPIALTRLVSTYEAKGNMAKVGALRKASKKLFLIVGISGMVIMLVAAKPYTALIASSPKSIYTVIALAPSVLFSCMCGCHRAFSEGFLDMKPTALSQTVEAVFKMVFGLLFARWSMSYLYGFFIENTTVLGVPVQSEQEALSMIYPITSACAMLGVTLGSIVSYIVAGIYTGVKYNHIMPKQCDDVKASYNELVTFSVGLVGATVVQSIANFADTSSIQYCLSLCNEQALQAQYNVADDIYTYVFGIYAVALDFKNLIPSVVMALGVTAVPAVSSAFENGENRFSSLISSIFKYTVILSVVGGVGISLFYNEILWIFYSTSNSDIVDNTAKLLFVFGITSLPCAAASTSVFCAQGLGYAKDTILPFVASAIVRVVLNFLLISNDSINILGSAISNFFGFLIILIWNMIIIKRKTNCKFAIKEIFIKPLICGIMTYFVTDCIRNYITLLFPSKYVVIILCAAICLLSYVLLLFMMSSISLGEIKSLKKCKN